MEGAANLSAGEALRGWTERQRVAFVSLASLCHLRAPARRSARSGRGLRRGVGPDPVPRPRRAQAPALGLSRLFSFPASRLGGKDFERRVR